MQFGFGSGLLWGVRNDVTPATPVRFGALQDVQLDFKGDVKELYGQYQFPIDTARGKIKVSGKAKMAQINALIYNQLFFGQSMTTGQKLIAYDEVGTIPAVTPFTVQSVNHTLFVGDLGVRYQATGEYLQQVTAGSEAVGKYSVAAGIYTFSTADASKMVLLDYEYTAITGYTISGANLIMGSAPRFKGVFTETYKSSVITCILNSCICPSLSIPTKIDDYVVHDIEISAYADASGDVFELSMTSGAIG